MALVENVRNYKLCLPLKKDLAYQILACSKIYESRIAGSPESKLMNIEIGDVIAFHWYTNERVTAKVLQVQEFDLAYNRCCNAYLVGSCSQELH